MDKLSFADQLNVLQRQVDALQQQADRCDSVSSKEQLQAICQAMRQMLSTFPVQAEQRPPATNNGSVFTGVRIDSALFEFAPDACLITDETGIIQQANHVARTLLAAPNNQMVGRNMLEFVALEEHPVFHGLLNQVVYLERVQNKELYLQPIEGTPFYVAATVTVLSSGDAAEQTLLYWSIRDITKHKILEDIWRQYEFIANTSKDLMMLIDTEYRYVAVNEAFCRLHNRTRSDVINYPVADILGHDYFEQEMKPYLDRCFAGQEVNYQTSVGIPVMDQRYFEVMYYPYTNFEGQVTQVVIVSRDVTKRKLAEEALQRAHEELEGRVAERTQELSRINAYLKQQIVERERAKEALLVSEERYKHLLKAVTDYIYLVQVSEGQPLTTYHSPACVAVTGYNSEEYEANPNLWYEMIHPDDQQEVVSRLNRLLSGKDILPLEHRIIHRDHSIRWVQNTIVPRYDGAGNLTAYEGLVSDITERKKVEEERERLLIAEREQRLMAETLGEVFLALTSQINHKAVLDEILQQARRLVSYRAANIVLIEQGKLQTAHWQGYENLSQQGSINLSQQRVDDFPLDAHVIQTRQPLILSDVQQSSEWVIVPDLDWIKSFVAVPICLLDQVLGLLRLDGDRTHQFTAQDIERLQPLANAAAIALENARLYEQLQQELADRIVLENQAFDLNRKFLTLQYAGATVASSLDLQSVLNTFTQEMVGLLNVEGCAISEWDEGNGTISIVARYGPSEWWRARSLNTTYDLGDIPLIKWVLTQRQAQHLTVSQPDIEPNDLTYMQTNQMKTLLILPMEFQNRVVGLVEVMDDQNELSFHGNEVALAQLLANQAANAMENARLYDRAQKEIDERKRIEDHLRRSEARNRALLDAIPDSMFHLSGDGIYLDHKTGNVNDLYAPPEMFLGKSVTETLPPPVAKIILEGIEKTLTTGMMQILEYHLSLPNSEQDFESRMVAAGEQEVVAIVRNITESKRNKAALERSEANLKAIFENTLQAFVLVDHSYRIQAFNRTARFGLKLYYSKRIKEGDVIDDFVPVAQLPAIKAFLDQALRGKPVMVEQQINLNNREQWFEYHFDPVFAGEGMVIGVCFSTVDISERKKLANTLAESEARLLAEMQSVLAITRALVSQTDVSTLLEFIMTQAEHLTNAEGAAVLLLSDDGKWLEVARPDEAWLGISAGLRLLAEGSLAELAIASQRVQVSNRAQDDGRTASIRALLESVQLHSLLCAPLKVQGKNLGVLLIWNKRKQLFSDADNRLIGLFADQAALAWHNAHLHAKNRELAIEQERQRLARDLHDSVTQSLYSVGMAAQAALRILGESDSRVREPIKHIQWLSQTALTEMREQLHNLRPSMLANKGLVEVLDQYCDGLSDQYGLDIEFVAQLEPTLSVYQQESLYYIAREALWNIVKYAQAARVRILLDQDQEQVHLSIMDEGTGFAPLAINESEAMGLRGMRERAKLLGGSFEVKSEPGQGTRVTVRIPLKLPGSRIM